MFTLRRSLASIKPIYHSDGSYITNVINSICAVCVCVRAERVYVRCAAYILVLTAIRNKNISSEIGARTRVYEMHACI